MTYKQLCKNLADTENALRKGTVNHTFSTKGRYKELEYMKSNYPEKYEQYVKALDDRLSKPYDFKTILASIPAVG
jgi:hypothetical protein